MEKNNFRRQCDNESDHTSINIVCNARIRQILNRPFERKKSFYRRVTHRRNQEEEEVEGGQRPPQPLPQREREGGEGEGVGGAAFSSHFGGRPSSLLPSTAAGDLQNEQEEEEERMEEEEHGERREKGKTLFCAWCNSSFFSSSSLSLLAAPPSFSLSGKRRRQKPVGRRSRAGERAETRGGETDLAAASGASLRLRRPRSGRQTLLGDRCPL